MVVKAGPEGKEDPRISKKKKGIYVDHTSESAFFTYIFCTNCSSCLSPPTQIKQTKKKRVNFEGYLNVVAVWRSMKISRLLQSSHNNSEARFTCPAELNSCFLACVRAGAFAHLQYCRHPALAGDLNQCLPTISASRLHLSDIEKHKTRKEVSA